MKDLKKSGKTLKYLRKQNHYSIHDVSVILQIPARRVSDWDHGRKKPTDFELFALEQLYKLPNLVTIIYGEEYNLHYNSIIELDFPNNILPSPIDDYIDDYHYDSSRDFNGEDRIIFPE